MSRPVWRFVADDGVTASFGLAADEWLTERVGQGASPPVLRLYTYRSHCALVGRFQSLEAEVDRAYCEAHGIAVGRRPTGGGAILMGADQLGLAIALPEGRGERGYDRARDLFARLSVGVVRALAGLGVDASFRRKNDLEVEGRKIAGLGIYFHPPGGLLFHTSLLVGLDIPLMLRVLRTPFEKVSDKEIAAVAGRVTTVRRELGREIGLPEMRQRVRDAYGEALGVELREEAFGAEECQAIGRLERDKYASPSWISLRPLLPDTAGTSQTKTPGGLLNVGVTLAGETIKAIYITGDFFWDEEALATVERCLRWHPALPEAVAATLKRLDTEGVRLAALPAETLTEAITAACESARPATGPAPPRGCFVGP